MTLADTFKERLYQAAGINDETLSGWMVAHDIGVGVTKTIRDRNGIPSAEKLVAIAAVVGRTVDWLLGVDSTAMAEINEIKKSAPAESDEFVYIPRYDVTASAGNGSYVDNESPRFSMAFRRYWVTNYLRTSPKDLSVITVKGDSMEPLLKAGDNILVNHAEAGKDDGIYVLRLEDRIVVKRTLWKSSSKVEIISENTAYPAFEFDGSAANDLDFEVIGRVVWYGRQI